MAPAKFGVRRQQIGSQIVRQCGIFDPRLQSLRSVGNRAEIVSGQALYLPPHWLFLFQRGEETLESGGANHKTRGNADAGARKFAQRAALSANPGPVLQSNVS